MVNNCMKTEKKKKYIYKKKDISVCFDKFLKIYMLMTSLANPLQACKNCYQSVMIIVLVILLLLMLRNLYACSSNVLSTNTVTTQLYF